MTKTTIPEEEFAFPGSTGCPGCGANLVMRYLLKGLGERTVLSIPACCWAVMPGYWPSNCLKVPILYTAFEATGAGISGLRAAFDAKGVKDVTVVGFGTEPAVRSAMTADRAATAAAVGSLEAAGETALYDAVALGARQFTTPRRATVLLSDGKDTASRATLDDAVRAVGGARSSFYGVLLESPDLDPAAVERLARSTGGQVVRAADPGALEAVYDEIGAELAALYQLTFTATQRGSTAIEVTATAGDATASAATRAVVPVAASAPDPAPARVPAPVARPAAQADWWEAGWVLGAGLAAVFVGLVVAGLVLFAPRSRPSQLAGAAAGAATASHGTPLRSIAEHATQMAEERLERSGRRRGLERTLERAGVDMRPGEFLVLAATIGFVTLMVGLLLGGPLLGLGLAVVAFFGVRLAVSLRVERRQARFAEQLEQTLPLMAGSLRAGFGIMQSLDAVARESESPTAEEFRRLVVETRLGRDVSDALHAMAERVDSEDFRWVVQAIDIHRQVGGDLAEVLDNVYATIRDRNRIRRQIQALSGEGRLSAGILFALPFVMLALIQVLNPEYLGELTGSSVGVVMLVMGGGLMLVGGLWMRRIIRLVF